MADRAQIENALRNAHAAGDKAAATQLAKALRTMDEGGKTGQAMSRAKSNVAAGETAFDSLKGKVEDRSQKAIPGNFGHLVSEGATLGFGDEIRAGAKALPHLFSQKGFSAAYDDQLVKERAAISNYRAANPKKALGAEVAGAFLPALTGVGAIPAASNAAGRIGAGAAAGGAGAFMQGVGTGEGGAVNRVKRGVQAAPTGAAFGGGLAVAGEGVRRGIGALSGRRMSTPRGGSVEEKSLRKVNDALASDQVGHEAVRNGIVDGKPQTLMDLGGHNVRSLAGVAARRDDESRGAMARLFAERQAGSQDRVIEDVTSLVGGPPRDMRAAVTAIQSRRAKEAAVNYGEAHAQPPAQTTQGLVDLSKRPSVQRALRDASGRAAERGEVVRVSKEALRLGDDLNLPPEARDVFNEIESYRSDISGFDDAVADAAQRSDARFKRPMFREIIKRGGVDPQSPLATEARMMGITSQTAPGFYRKGGISAVDNLSDLDLSDGLNIAKNGDYYNPDDILELLRTEYSTGVPTRSASEAAAASELDALLRSEPEIDELRGIVSGSDRAEAARLAEMPELNMTPAGWDYTLRGLNAQIDKAEKMGDAEAVQALTATRNALAKEVDSVAPGLGKARAAYASDSALLDAADTGRKFMRGDSDDLLSKTANYTPEQEEMARLGIGRAMLDKVARKRPEMSSADPLRTMDVTDRLETVFEPDAVNSFRARLDAEKGMANTRNDVLGNSATAERLAADRNFAGGLLGRVATRSVEQGGGLLGVTNAATGEVGQVISDMIQSGLSSKRAQEIGSMMTEPDVQEVVKRLMEQAARDAEFRPAYRTLSGSAVVGSQSIEDK